MPPDELTYWLPVEIRNHNDGRGRQWYRSSTIRRKYFKILLDLGFQRNEPFNYQADLVITRILGKGQRLWDADSIGRGSAKELLDSLVQLGWFHDDGPKWIRNCDYRQMIDRDRGPAATIQVARAII